MLEAVPESIPSSEEAIISSVDVLCLKIHQPVNCCVSSFSCICKNRYVYACILKNRVFSCIIVYIRVCFLKM